MFEQVTEPEERGQVGIGTLIVFIAMVLVAAIAAGVLINTAGILQTQASDTGTETQEAVANQIEVVHATGGVGDDQVNNLTLTIKQSAGSNPIDLTAMTIHYTSDATAETLVHTSLEDPDGDPGDPAGPQFATDPVGDHNDDGESLTETDQRVELVIELNDPNDEDSHDEIEEIGDLEPLEGGDSATVALVDQSGAEFTYGVTVPQTFGDAEVVEV